MPQVAVAAAAWIGSTILTVTGSATIAAAAANFVAAAGFAQGIGAAVGAWATIGSVATRAAGKPKIGDQGKGTQVDWKADPNAGIPYVVGQTGTAGQIVFATTAEPKNHLLCYLTVHSLGPVQEVVRFKVNGQPVTFSADNANEAPYHNFMLERRQAGEHAPAAFMPPGVSPGGLPEWTEAHKLTGLAAQWWALAYDKNGKVYPTGTPKPQTVLKGVRVYDPRLDSTYPGGSGPCRAGNEATYVYSENAPLHALTFALGRYQNGKKLMGLGAPVEMIDVPSFVEAANVNDANGWKIGGVVYSTDSKWEVFKAMLQAGGAWPCPLGAKISCSVLTPRVSLATIAGDDAVGEVVVTAAQSRRDRYNAVIPSYRSAAHDYQVVPAARISIPTYLADDDNQERTLPAEFPLVPDVDQAAELGIYAVANGREFGPITIPAKPTWAGFRPGDCITVDEPEWGLNGQKCLIISRQRDWASGVITLGLMSETDAKHPFALGQTGTPPPTPGLTGVDGAYVPTPDDGSWVAEGTVLAGPDGALPVIRITGAADAELISAIIVDYRELLDEGPPPVWGPWISQEYPPSTTEILITGLKPGVRYQVRVRYRNTHGTEDPDDGLDLGPHMPGPVGAGLVGNKTAQQVEAAIQAMLTFIDKLAAAVGDIDDALDEKVEEVSQALVDTWVQVSETTGSAQAFLDTVVERSLGTRDVKAWTRDKVFIDGRTVGSVVVEVREVTDTLVHFTDLIGVVNGDGTAVVLNDSFVMADGVTSVGAAILEVTSALGDFQATVTNDYYTKVDADAAIAAASLALEATFGDTLATALTDYVTQADQTSALASLQSTITASYNDAISTATSGLVSTTDMDSALSSLQSTITANYNSAISSATSNLVSTSQMNSAFSSYDTTVKAWVNGNPASQAKITADAFATLSGQVYGRVMLQATSGNVVTGISILSSGGATNVSAVIIEAAAFQIKSSSSPTITPFTYDAVSGTLFVQNVTIRNANIESAAITRLKVAVGELFQRVGSAAANQVTVSAGGSGAIGSATITTTGGKVLIKTVVHIYPKWISAGDAAAAGLTAPVEPVGLFNIYRTVLTLASFWFIYATKMADGSYMVNGHIVAFDIPDIPAANTWNYSAQLTTQKTSLVFDYRSFYVDEQIRS